MTYYGDGEKLMLEIASEMDVKLVFETRSSNPTGDGSWTGFLKGWL